ncbi:12020_t:CDS:1, partial [Ambispora gerdemannii]
VSIPTESQISDSSSSGSIQENDQDESTAQNSASLKLPEVEVSIPTSNHLVTVSDNKSQPPILILPEDSKEKQNH